MVAGVVVEGVEEGDASKQVCQRPEKLLGKSK
jgi:hypothetical protein